MWFTEQTADEVVAALSATSILWERYRTFADVVTEDKVTANPLFTELDQPRIGRYLAPGCRCRSTVSIRLRCAAPALGDHTAAVLRDRLGLTDSRDRRAGRVGHRRMSVLLDLLDVG